MVHLFSNKYYQNFLSKNIKDMGFYTIFVLGIRIQKLGRPHSCLAGLWATNTIWTRNKMTLSYAIDHI